MLTTPLSPQLDCGNGDAGDQPKLAALPGFSIGLPHRAARRADAPGRVGGDRPIGMCIALTSERGSTEAVGLWHTYAEAEFEAAPTVSSRSESRRTEKSSSQPSTKLVLMEVSNPYRDAFSRWAAEQNIEVVSCARHTALGQSTDTSLCVYESMKGEDLVNSIPALAKIIRTAPLVVLASRISISATVQLVRAGVQEVIEIPASAPDVLARAAARATSLGVGALDRLLVGSGPPMRRVRRELAAVAPIATTVLITGQ